MSHREQVPIRAHLEAGASRIIVFPGPFPVIAFGIVAVTFGIPALFDAIPKCFENPEVLVEFDGAKMSAYDELGLGIKYTAPLFITYLLGVGSTFIRPPHKWELGDSVRWV